MYDNDLFWSNIRNVNPKISSIPTTMDGKHSQLEIASVFMHKYKSLYTSVPTFDEQMNTINSSISERLLHSNEDVCCVTPIDCNYILLLNQLSRTLKDSLICHLLRLKV